MSTMTPRAWDAAQAVYAWQEAYGTPPRLVDVADLLGIQSSRTYMLLGIAASNGVLSGADGSYRRFHVPLVGGGALCPMCGQRSKR